MTNKIIFNNNTELEIIGAERQVVYHEGANREALSIRLSPETIGLDEADSIFSNAANTESLQVQLDDGQGGLAEEILHNYSLPVEIGKKDFYFDTEAGPVSQPLVVAILAKKTYRELQMEQILAAMAAQNIKI